MCVPRHVFAIPTEGGREHAGADDQPEIVEDLEPRRQLVLGQPLGVDGGLNHGKGFEAPRDELVMHQAPVFGIAFEVVDVCGREQAHQTRLLPSSGFPR